MQLARERGAHVIAVVEDAKRELATSLGAAETIADDREDVVPAIEALAPGGVDAVLDLTSDGGHARRQGRPHPVARVRST